MARGVKGEGAGFCESEAAWAYTTARATAARGQARSPGRALCPGGGPEGARLHASACPPPALLHPGLCHAAPPSQALLDVQTRAELAPGLSSETLLALLSRYAPDDLAEDRLPTGGGPRELGENSGFNELGAASWSNFTLVTSIHTHHAHQAFWRAWRSPTRPARRIAPHLTGSWTHSRRWTRSVTRPRKRPSSSTKAGLGSG